MRRTFIAKSDSINRQSFKSSSSYCHSPWVYYQFRMLLLCCQYATQYFSSQIGVPNANGNNEKRKRSVQGDQRIFSFQIGIHISEPFNVLRMYVCVMIIKSISCYSIFSGPFLKMLSSSSSSMISEDRMLCQLLLFCSAVASTRIHQSNCIMHTVAASITRHTTWTNMIEFDNIRAFKWVRSKRNVRQAIAVFHFFISLPIEIRDIFFL